MPLFLFVVVLATNAHDCQILNYFMTHKKKRDRKQREDKRKDLDNPTNPMPTKIGRFIQFTSQFIALKLVCNGRAHRGGK